MTQKPTRRRPARSMPLVRPRAACRSMPRWARSSTPSEPEASDNAIIIVRLSDVDEGEVVGVAEESWAKKGGMDDTAEVHG